MKNKRPIKDEHVIFSDDFQSSSARECTGLIPTAPADEEALESYKEIMTFSPDDIMYHRNSD